MAKKYKKTKQKISNWIWMIIGLVITIGIGGLFIDGGFMNVVLLKFLPLLVHKIVGWVIVVGGILGFILGLMKK